MTTKINGTNTAANPAITGADTDTGLSFGTDTVNINTGGTTKATVDSNGRLGIGTTSPNRVVEINNSQPCIRLTNGTNGFDIGTGGFVDGSNSLIFYDEGVGERMRINSSGLVGIGTTSPTEDLHVSKNGGGAVGIVAENTATSGEAVFNLLGKNSGGTVRTCMLKYDAGDNFRIGSPSAIAINFETSDAQRMKISSGGNIGAPTGSNIYNVSDSRLKKNIVTLDKGLTSINALRPVSFNWIDGFCDEEKDTLYGFIAQEVKTVDPNLVQQFGADGSVEVNGEVIEDTIRVNEKFVIPMLVKAIQELSAKVTALETKVAALEAA